METWKTREGQEIPIVDMSEEHVRNAIRHCERFLLKLDRMMENNSRLLPEEMDFPIDPFDGVVDPQVAHCFDGLIKTMDEILAAKQSCREKLAVLQREASRRGLS